MYAFGERKKLADDAGCSFFRRREIKLRTRLCKRRPLAALGSSVAARVLGRLVVGRVFVWAFGRLRESG